MKALDLFCGCGGISAGLKAAGLKVVAGIDIEPKYISTFSHNFPSAQSLQLDISSTPPEELADIVGLKRGELTVLAGGPPCQGFSKNVPRKHRYLEDANNLLVRSFLDHCEHLLPKIVIMENVAEMKNGFEQSYSQEITERLEAAGYSILHDVLNAADYGIPQRRRRAFFVGWRKSTVPSFPKTTHSKQGDNGDLFNRSSHVTVWEGIGDLPSLHHGKGESPCLYATEPFSDFQRSIRNGSNEVSNHIARELRPTQYERLAILKPGQGLKDLPDHLKVKGGYSGAYGRLTKDMVAPTITRWVFHPGSGRWGHPEDIRVLTIREAARIQGFYDEFEFIGTYNEQAGQVGNAVPPLLIKSIAEHLISNL